MPELAKKWIRFLKRNPRKTKGALDRGRGRRCCLGHLCFIDEDLERIRDSECFVYKTGEGHLVRSTLPWKTAGKVNLYCDGKFNEKGRLIVKEFIDKHSLKSKDGELESLVHVNDSTSITHRQMGQLIEKLYKNNGFEQYKLP